jgi:hypothetical protein
LMFRLATSLFEATRRIMFSLLIGSCLLWKKVLHKAYNCMLGSPSMKA